MKGIRITFKDGETEDFDPVSDNDIEQTETQYILHLTYDYTFDLSDIESIDFYELCEQCGYELDSVNDCSNCNPEYFL